MLHLRCEACRTRFQIDGRVSGVRDDRCPSCDSPLETPAQLAELVGFRLSGFDGPLPDADSDFLAAVAMALTPPDSEG
jgi:hypothetical protein